MKRNQRWKMMLAVGVLLLSLILGSCQKSETTEKTNLKISPQDYPTVDGSTLTIPFSEAVGAAVMDLPIEEARQYILHHTTHNAYINLIEGRADLLLATPPSEEELAYADQMGVEMELIPVLRDGFVFFVNEKNPVNDVTFHDLVEIYGGKTLNWSELGGDDKAIIAYQREPNSGSQTGMLHLVMKDVPMMEAPTEQIIGDMGAIIDAVALYDNEVSAIGYSYYYFVKSMWGDEHIKLLGIDGVKPTDDSIRDGSYPIASTTYLVLRKEEPKDSNARKLASWILSDEGQTLAEEVGYIRIQ